MFLSKTYIITQIDVMNLMQELPSVTQKVRPCAYKIPFLALKLIKSIEILLLALMKPVLGPAQVITRLDDHLVICMFD